MMYDLLELDESAAPASASGGETAQEIYGLEEPSFARE